MQKIYDKYLKLKSENKNKIYLFKTGLFFIFVGDDADYISKVTILKKIPFGNSTYKCGFPVKNLNKYMNVFTNLNLDIEVISEEIENTNVEKIIEVLNNIDINNTTPAQSFEILTKLKGMIHE